MCEILASRDVALSRHGAQQLRFGSRALQFHYWAPRQPRRVENNKQENRKKKKKKKMQNKYTLNV